MKKILTLLLAAFMLMSALCGCGSDSDTGSSSDKKSSSVSASGSSKADKDTGKDDKTTAPEGLPNTYEIAATDPHYIIATPDWRAEGYGCGFALNEKGNKDYAIVVACGSSADDAPLNEAFTVLYDDTFKGILMQNYRAKYADFTPDITETKLADGSSALLFKGIQPADDYGTELNCSVYGYSFSHDGVPFIVAYVVMKDAAADEAKCAEMKEYVDNMINTVRTAK